MESWSTHERCCDIKDAPVVVEVGRDAENKPILFGHRTPYRTSKATLDMVCARSFRENPSWQRDRYAHIILRVPVHLDGYSDGKKIDVFVIFPAEYIESMHMTHFTAPRPDVDGATRFPEDSCECYYKKPTEPNTVPFAYLAHLPKPVHHALAHKDSFEGVPGSVACEKEDPGEGYLRDVLAITLKITRPPWLITPDGEAIDGSTDVSREMTQHLMWMAFHEALVTFYISRRYVPHLRKLRCFQRAIAEGRAGEFRGIGQHLQTADDDDDAEYRSIYRDGWSKFGNSRSSSRKEERLTGGVFEIYEDDSDEDTMADRPLM
ncbi:hypothetical protein HDK90DRAFT_557913 [Phyllosticta capitalensis]|uniref:Uncharacterized protein n=1 Tax=Phyllosticta capitalensis TaxID=121624 RepID=A0ABR1YGY3_9PEZI